MSVFDEVLADMARKDGLSGGKPHVSPANDRSWLANVALESMDSPGRPIASFRQEYMASVQTGQRSEMQPTEKTLKQAFAATKKKLTQKGQRDLAALKKIRASYANHFHPDRLPDSLKQLANSQLAEINACIDAAKAASTI